eukprot:Hpha_TRINITY_DN15307_c5_g9::TRINITY_DN15307_c5_g9_i1::g.92253::m.92253
MSGSGAGTGLVCERPGVGGCSGALGGGDAQPLGGGLEALDKGGVVLVHGLAVPQGEKQRQELSGEGSGRTRVVLRADEVVDGAVTLHPLQRLLGLHPHRDASQLLGDTAHCRVFCVDRNLDTVPGVGREEGQQGGSECLWSGGCVGADDGDHPVEGRALPPPDGGATVRVAGIVPRPRGLNKEVVHLPKVPLPLSTRHAVLQHSQVPCQPPCGGLLLEVLRGVVRMVRRGGGRDDNRELRVLRHVGPVRELAKGFGLLRKGGHVEGRGGGGAHVVHSEGGGLEELQRHARVVVVDRESDGPRLHQPVREIAKELLSPGCVGDVQEHLPPLLVKVVRGQLRPDAVCHRQPVGVQVVPLFHLTLLRGGGVARVEPLRLAPAGDSLFTVLRLTQAVVDRGDLVLGDARHHKVAHVGALPRVLDH